MANETIITVVGNLTAPPELRFTPNGAAVANFTVASTPRTFDRQSNEWKDGEALFLRCSVWKEVAENVAAVVQRTVLPGNMLAFGSPDSAKMADLIVTAFTGAEPTALKGSQVLFIGNPADNERVKAAVEAAGAKYIFVEAK